MKLINVNGYKRNIRKCIIEDDFDKGYEFRLDEESKMELVGDVEKHARSICDAMSYSKSTWEKLDEKYRKAYREASKKILFQLPEWIRIEEGK